MVVFTPHFKIGPFSPSPNHHGQELGGTLRGGRFEAWRADVDSLFVAVTGHLEENVDDVGLSRRLLECTLARNQPACRICFC